MSQNQDIDAFGQRSRGPRRLLLWLGAVAGLAVTAVAVYVAGAGSSVSADSSAAGGHNHAAAPVADSAMPVTLSDTDRQRIGITFTTVERIPLDRQVRTVAQVTYDETRIKQVVIRVDGYVEQLFVSATGQQVARGQPLFAIYSPMVTNTFQEMLLAQRLEEQVRGGTPDAMQGAEALLESARMRLLNWEVPSDIIAEVLRTGKIGRTITFRSPVSGVVVEKPVLAGQRLMAGEVAYKIVDLSRIWIEGEVFEPDLPSVKVGQRVSAEFAALPGEERSGSISYVYPTLNPETRTARIRVEMPNPDLRLKPGMYATILFSATTPRVLSVLRSAVLVTGKRTLVFVRDSSGTLIPREVTAGLVTADRVEILNGLREGETVVASATFLVDAESNLGSALGGMADMPGMDVNVPPVGLEQTPARPESTSAMPDMPGMNHDHDSSKPE
jgi:Cu(I)/Ag(I) efflux system membrane fusion protein